MLNPPHGGRLAQLITRIQEVLTKSNQPGYGFVHEYGIGLPERTRSTFERGGDEIGVLRIANVDHALAIGVDTLGHRIWDLVPVNDDASNTPLFFISDSTLKVLAAARAKTFYSIEYAGRVYVLEAWQYRPEQLLVATLAVPTGRVTAEDGT